MNSQERHQESEAMRDCETDGMKLENYPAYVREWMDREKD